MNKQRIPIKLLVQLGITAACITVAAIVFRQSFFRVFPTYVSLVIGLLLALVNRYANLVGGCNAILHGIVAVYYGLYGSAACSFLFSSPIQLVSFINWSKNRQGQNTTLKRMTPKQRIVLCIILVAVEIPLYWLMMRINGSYALLDSLVFLTSTAQSCLTMFRYKEYTILMLIACTTNVLLYLFMSFQTPEQITYLIYGIYTLYCAVLAYRNAAQLFIQQQKSGSMQ